MLVRRSVPCMSYLGSCASTLLLFSRVFLDRARVYSAISRVCMLSALHLNSSLDFRPKARGME
jgi:hypothetical protein